MRGRRPKPTNLKVIQGNPGRRPLNPREPKPPAGAGEPPGHLSAAARQFWPGMAQRLEGMGVLTDADTYALERLAECYAEIIDLQRVIDEEGRTYQTTTYGKEGDSNTMHRQRPEVAMLSDADRRFKGYLVEFGLTPAARCKVQTSAEEEADPLQDYIAR